MNPYADADEGTPTAPMRRGLPHIEPHPAGVMPVITREQVIAAAGRWVRGEDATETVVIPAAARVNPRRLPVRLTAALSALRPEMQKLAAVHAALLRDIDRLADRIGNLEHELRAEGYLP